MCNLCLFIPIYYAFVHVKSQFLFIVCDVTSHFFKTGSFSSCITSMFMLVVCSLDDTSTSKMVYFKSFCDISVGSLFYLFLV